MYLLTIDQTAPFIYDIQRLEEDVPISAHLLTAGSVICSGQDLEEFCVFDWSCNYLYVTIDDVKNGKISVAGLVKNHEVRFGNFWGTVGRLRAMHDEYFEFVVAGAIKIFTKEFGFGAPFEV